MKKKNVISMLFYDAAPVAVALVMTSLWSLFVVPALSINLITQQAMGAATSSSSDNITRSTSATSITTTTNASTITLGKPIFTEYDRDNK